jgi:hypothetical protein
MRGGGKVRRPGEKGIARRPGRAKREAREQREREFLASVFSAEDIRAFIKERFPGVSYRRFTDERHRTLWRALEVLELGEEGNHGERGDRATERELRLYEELQKAGALKRAGGKKYLRDVLGSSTTELYAAVAAWELGISKA